MAATVCRRASASRDRGGGHAPAIPRTGSKGRSRRGAGLAQAKDDARGRSAGPGGGAPGVRGGKTAERPRDERIRSRQDAIRQRYLEYAAGLQGTGTALDRELALRIRQFVKDMPAIHRLRSGDGASSSRRAHAKSGSSSSVLDVQKFPLVPSFQPWRGPPDSAVTLRRLSSQDRHSRSRAISPIRNSLAIECAFEQRKV